MAGGIPSGSDPTGWEAGTVGSNPAQGYDPTASAGAVVGTGSALTGQLTGVAAGISNMISRTQDVITSAYQDLVQNDSTLTGYSDQLFAGLNPDGSTPLSTLIIQAIGLAMGIPQAELTSTENSLAAIKKAWTTLGQAWTQLETFLETGSWSSLSAAWNDLMQGLFGSGSNPGLLGIVPSAALTNVTTQNMQPLATFPNAASVLAGGGWSWDGTVDHSGLPGSGSALYVAAGLLGTLSGIPISVQSGQTVNPQAYVQWSGLTAASGTSPIQLQLQPGTFDAAGDFTAAGNVVVLQSITSPAASGSWTELTGSYPVPADGSVTAIQVSLVVTSDATAGSVWFDDCLTNVSGGWFAELMSDFQLVLASFGGGGTAAEFVQGISNILSLFGLSSLTGSIDVSSVWTTIVTDIINPLNALEVQASKIVGEIEQAAVAGLAAIQTDLIDAWNWVTRLIQDEMILLDVFHLTYNAGKSGDAPGTLWTGGGIGEGKPTWYSAWSDLMALFGAANSVAAPTDPPPTIGASISAAAAAATTAGTNASMALSSASAASTATQGLQDTLVSAQYGSTITNSTLSQVTTGYTAIPASNVVGIAPAAVAFGAVGGSATGEGSVSSGIATASEYHAIAAGDTGVIVALGWSTGIPTGTTLPTTVTFGGHAMTLLGTVVSAPAGYVSGYLQLWWLKSPPSGSQQVLASINLAGMASDNGLLEVWLASGSYSASATGTASSISGTGTGLSTSVGSAAGHMAVAAFMSIGEFAAASISGFTQTQRYNTSVNTGVDTAFAFGDAPGNAAGVTFGATGSGASSHWAGIVVDIHN